MTVATRPGSSFSLGRFLTVRAVSVVLAIALAAVFSATMMGGASGFYQRLALLAGLYVALAVSLNLINGITGQFSLGHIAFYAVGAYSAAAGSKYLYPSLASQPVLIVLVSMVFGTVTAAFAGLVVGLPSLRLKGDYLAIVTLGVGEIVRIFAQNQEALGKSYGIAVAPKVGFIWLSTLLAITTIAVCRNLQSTARGLNFLAVREDEIAASAMGVDVTKTKVAAFIIGSAFAGAAGALAAHYEGFIGPNLYTMDYSILIVAMVVLGGTGSITGSVLAALVLFSVPEFMRSYKGTAMANVIGVLFGVIMAVALLRLVAKRFHGGPVLRGLLVLAVLAATVVFAAFIQALLRQAPALQEVVEGNKLRQVIPAVTLVVMMLLRPQGIFGHREIGWASLFGRFGGDGHPSSGPGAPPQRTEDSGDGPGESTLPPTGISTETTRQAQGDIEV